MATGIVTSAYIIAAIFFILALAGLSKQETAKNGNMFGMIGMAIALIATIFSEDVNGLIWIIIAMLGGAIVGIYKAKKVEMTQMPELIALLHSFVGLTAVLVGFNSFIQSDMLENPDMETVHLIEVFLGVFIGAVTFTGSIVAWGKLKGKISGKPMTLPHKHLLNLGALVLSLILLIVFVAAEGSWVCLILMTMIALAFGWHLVASIGGADMPVVVSMLNSYSN